MLVCNFHVQFTGVFVRSPSAYPWNCELIVITQRTSYHLPLDNSATQYLGDFSSAEDCGAAAAAAGQLAWSWHDPSFGSDDFASSCFAIIDGSWQLTPEEGTVCAYWARSNTHVAELQSLNLFPTGSFNGLRVDGRRAVRARYPDGDPEKLGGAFSSQDASMGDGSCISSPIHPSLRYPSIY